MTSFVSFLSRHVLVYLKTFTRQGCVKTSVATIRQSGKCVQAATVYSRFFESSNLMHFLCREPLNLKTGARERSFSEKHRGNNKHNICNHLSGEMVIYLSKNVLTFFAIGGEGKGTHSPESKYVVIRITASANSLLQMELPTTLS